MKILFIGDIFGKAGINIIAKHLADLKKQYDIDFTIANAENTTLCRGLDMQDYQTLNELGIDFFTMGNHTWKQKDFQQVLTQNNIVRPGNISGNIKYTTVGNGYRTIEVNNKKLLIINVLGQSVSLHPVLEINIDNPFNYVEEVLLNQKADIIICDFHGETTSEKNCFLQVFKSQCTAILGTHTHVQTNDNMINGETAYITDVGMTGPYDAIIGADAESIIKMFTGESERFLLSEANTGSQQLNAVVIEVDDTTNKPIKIDKINITDL